MVINDACGFLLNVVFVENLEEKNIALNVLKFEMSPNLCRRRGQRL